MTTKRKPTRAKQLGVTDDEYARLLAAQDGHCALCPNTPKTRRLHVDHEHGAIHADGSPVVRGLLCHRCNRALPSWITREWLEAAAYYIDPPPAAGKPSPHVSWFLSQRFPSHDTGA